MIDHREIQKGAVVAPLTLMAADARQLRTSMVIDSWRFGAENSELAELRIRERSGEELTDAEREHIGALAIAVFVGIDWRTSGFIVGTLKIEVLYVKNLKTTLSILFSLAISPFAVAGDVDGLHSLALQYFEAKVATQQPDATAEDLEAYLALLTDNVGYEHKPYRLLDQNREDQESGKQRMREGMTYYLGGNEKFTAELDSVAVGHNAIAIQYSGTHEFRRGGEGPILIEQYTLMEVLEIVDGRVSIIREYND